MGNTHIVVLRKNQIIIVLAAVAALALLTILLTTGHTSASGDSAPVSAHPAVYDTEALYQPGVYTCSMALNDTVLNLEVVVDAAHINSIRLVSLEDSVTTMYPLIEPALDSLAEQLTNDVPLTEVRLSDAQKYTQMFLLEVIEQALAKAAK